MKKSFVAEYKYIYDPNHKHRPEKGTWNMTNSGWSSNNYNPKSESKTVEKI